MECLKIYPEFVDTIAAKASIKGVKSVMWTVLWLSLSILPLIAKMAHSLFIINKISKKSAVCCQVVVIVIVVIIVNPNWLKTVLFNEAVSKPCLPVAPPNRATSPRTPTARSSARSR